MTILDRLLGRAPCTCPVPMAAYLTGDRCERHGEATEAAMPKKGGRA